MQRCSSGDYESKRCGLKVVIYIIQELIEGQLEKYCRSLEVAMPGTKCKMLPDRSRTDWQKKFSLFL